MIQYHYLTQKDRASLLRERVLELEAEHFRTLLELEELPKNAELEDKLRELERRIARHTAPQEPLPAPSDPEPSPTDN